MNAVRIIDSARVLEKLKDFQRNTVEHAYRELYREGGSGRFLVADEVGLGKTLVARGVIAKMLDLQGSRIGRIDVVYVCSNSAIARQNLKKLIPRLDIPAAQIGLPGQASRLTLLPKTIRDLSGKRVNFISFTPGTTFEHQKSRQGRADERAVIYKLLEPFFAGREGRLRKVMQADGEKSFNEALEDLEELDSGLSDKYRRRIRGMALFTRLGTLVDEYDRRRRGEFKETLCAVIAELRELLAQVCLNALEPDLVILDEFQRFKELLEMDDDEESLPSRLFRYSDRATNADTKVLLLSATPYKMYTCDSDVDEPENHYADYLRTLKFLFKSKIDLVAEVERRSKAHRNSLSEPGDGWVESKASLEALLKRVMCRTERVALTRGFDAMMKDVPVRLPLRTSDLKEAPKLDALARYLDADDVISYWGSVPYALNFLRDYDLGRRLERALGAPGRKAGELSRLIGQIKQFRRTMYNNCGTELRPANHRMRYLFDRSLGGAAAPLWKLLWLPPSLPYTVPSGVFGAVGQVTKTLVFSAWNAVPDAIATMVSAEAERRMYGRDISSRRGAGNVFKPRLVFRAQDDGVVGVTTLLLLLPFASLLEYDPLESAVAAGKPLDLADLRRSVSCRIARRVENISFTGRLSGAADSNWYWAAPILMDEDETFRTWLMGLRGSEEGDESAGLLQCLGQVRTVLEHPETLGRRPDDLVEVLTEVAIAGPGVCSARALMRVFGIGLCPALFDSAYEVGDGFRSLFNKYAVVALVDREMKSRRNGFWRKALAYCSDGNVQALLDEHVHMLCGFGDDDGETKARSAALDIRKALAIRASSILVQEFPKKEKVGEPFRVACRYAMRFGGTKKSAETDRQVVRDEDVRLAFDSPFRPFVLASTSIGQEGLDFHQWCHAVMHWNLPSNPVDLEQREGRVHRYKGHAVRKNVAAHYGVTGLRDMEKGTDPWEHLFARAERERDRSKSELVPCWVYEDGDAKIERLVPYVPLSRTEERLAALKRGLGRYRLAFGQPRQEELVAIYSDRGVEEIRQRTLSLLPSSPCRLSCSS